MRDQTQSRLLSWAAVFLILQSIILTLSPAVRERSWDVEYRFSHWIGIFVWGILITIAHRITAKHLPERDPYLLPAAALLSGWGMLTVWRLDEAFGLRQTIWLGISFGALFSGIIYIKKLSFLRRYKYVFLSGGILVTALTLLLGTNPLGFGPKLWLGCCGVFFQPSEPLKLLLVIYLSAYFADRTNLRLFSFPLLVPTLLVTGIALLLLLVQRDLGTASIFVLVFTIIIFLTTGKRRILLSAVLILFLSLVLGIIFIDLINVRVIAWINPWNDPSGNSYQIVQSLLAVANGGIIGRGLGIGSPLLVPVAISDFIYSAIAEETGLIGTVSLLATIWLILARGIIISLHATDRFRRYLSAGIVTYFGVQSLLIIGGNIRLLPLTGVTLPFVSYGGSSLLTSFIGLFLLLAISDVEDNEPALIDNPAPYSLLSGLFALGLAACALTTSWWAISRSPDLLERTDNPRRAISDRHVPRGNIYDRNNEPINITEGNSGGFTRTYIYPELAPIIGYTHPVFGQAGLESIMDDYLRGLRGNPTSLIQRDQVIYGTPPPGLDIRLSIDLSLQGSADQLLANHTGAVIMMNAETGEILVMASHPTYDPNNLDNEGDSLSQDSSSPLLNRATQGLYPIGDELSPLIQAEFGETKPNSTQLYNFYQKLGLYEQPAINLPTAFDVNSNPQELRISPLHAAIALSVLSNEGIEPAPRIANAVNTIQQGWVVLPSLGTSTEVFDSKLTRETAIAFTKQGDPFWDFGTQVKAGKSDVTWLVSGTLPDWQGTPLVVVVAIEEHNMSFAEKIRDSLLNAGLNR